ncbi:MAG: glucose-6-phosphate isomerase [Inquilinus limosus]|uniref:Glucose-6-phosphate isomerase n=1 Tax=Inquilinus limosus TaxID=171674 RepID=A0A952KBD6_9PROT|nr:glucose-6-phosphate isomerase [Inquilinus limosus]
MQLREPGRCVISVTDGSLSGATGRYVKRLADLSGLYGDAAAFAAAVEEGGDRIVYEVQDYRPSAVAGDLIFGVTRMVPGRIGREYFLTRGHIHARADRPEIYTGEAGRGLMLMESPSGEIRIVEIEPRTICYVPPYWIHRSVNVGDGELVMSFCYPADAGQDYGIIEQAGGMRQRILDDGAGGWVAVDNPGYRPRPQARIDALFAGA